MSSVPAWVAAGISAIFGIQSWWSSRRSKEAREAADKQAEQATEAAERATEAAENAVAAQGHIAAETKRLADATERQWDAAEENPWRIERDDKGDHLRNLTATTKYHVHLRGGPVRVDGRRMFYEIAGNDSPEVDLLEAWRVLADKTVIVSWYPTKEKAGEPKQQRIQL
jgi:hypothetical protein